MTGPYRCRAAAQAVAPESDRPLITVPKSLDPTRQVPMSTTANPTADASPGTAKKSFNLAGLQRLGRRALRPTAALPAAGLLLRLGQPDMLGRFSALKTVANVIAA